MYQNFRKVIFAEKLITENTLLNKAKKLDLEIMVDFFYIKDAGCEISQHAGLQKHDFNIFFSGLLL